MSPQPRGFLEETIAERVAVDRYWDRVVVKPGCWAWLGSKLPSGYGLFGHRGRSVYAHRFSYTLHKGSIPGGWVVMHKCDNPECSNPLHLEVGTQADNRRDCAAKGRNPLNGNHLKTHCKRDHDLSITSRRTGRGNQRVCTECERMRQRGRKRIRR
jgi:hypothetical protein